MGVAYFGWTKESSRLTVLVWCVWRKGRELLVEWERECSVWKALYLKEKI